MRCWDPCWGEQWGRLGVERTGSFLRVTVEGMRQRVSEGLRLRPSKFDLEPGPHGRSGAQVVPEPAGQSVHTVEAQALRKE